MSEFGVALAQVLAGSSAGCRGLMDFEEQVTLPSRVGAAACPTPGCCWELQSQGQLQSHNPQKGETRRINLASISKESRREPSRVIS